MYEIDKVKFGEFISELRKEKGITQKELASQLFISDKAISKWETGHSVPDITLLVPLAELLGVTVTELLECRRIEQADKLDVAQTDNLVKKVIGLSEEEKAGRPQIKKKNVLIYLGCIFIALLELFVIHQIEHMYYFEIFILMTVGMCMLFGIYFWFFIREKLPSYYDENKINVYVDGIMHMNMPGVYFNNNNWPYIVKALRVWSVLGMTVFPVLFIWLSSVFEAYRPTSDVFITLLFLLGGLFVPVYGLGRKYMYTAESIRIEHESNVKKVRGIVLIVVVILGFLLVTGNARTKMELATRVGCVEHSTRNEWTMEYMFCDGFMQRTMWTEEDETDVNVVVETEEGTIGITIKDKDGNVIFEEENIQTGTYQAEVTGKYTVHIETEDHKGSFHIGN